MTFCSRDTGWIQGSGEFFSAFLDVFQDLAHFQLAGGGAGSDKKAFILLVFHKYRAGRRPAGDDENLPLGYRAEAKLDKRGKLHPDVLIEEIGKMLQVFVRIGELVGLQPQNVALVIHPDNQIAAG